MTTPALLWRTLVMVLIMAETQWSLCDSTKLRTGHPQFISRAAIERNWEIAALERRGRAAPRFNIEVDVAETNREGIDINGNTSSKEVEVLISFKNGITRDPMGVLGSWLANSSDPCSWLGVKCSSPSSIHVIRLNLSGLGLEGMVSASLGQLSFLQQLDLSDNVLHGSIPNSLTNCSNLMYLNMSFNQITGEIPALLGNLDNLQTLSLSYNNISGEIPTTIGNCSSLLVLFLGTNSIRGGIPPQIGLLSNLRSLDVSFCFLSGSVPASLGNCSSLQSIAFPSNPSLGGELPIQLGKLIQLQIFHLESCNFHGSFPMWALNLTSMQHLNMGFNYLFSGPIPKDVGSNFPNLTYLGLHYNSFSGVIPKSLANITSFHILYLDHNQLTGTIPHELGLLQNCLEFYVHQNALTGLIPSSLSNCSLLQWVDLGNNTFDPQPFPQWMVSLRNLQAWFLGEANLQGAIPSETGELSQLTIFSVYSNNLTGAIPSSLGNCTSLQYFEVHYNQLTGEIPSELGQRDLYTFLVNNNAFPVGPFPALVYNLTSLGYLDVGDNQFKGMLDGDFGRFGQLLSFRALNNDFHGPFPESVTNCSELSELDLGVNNFSGGLPPMLGNLSNLNILRLGSNNFDGAIPVDFLGNLRLLQTLDLSENNLSGPIPVNIGRLLYLQSLNMSRNNLMGPLPDSLASCTQLLSLDLSQNQLTGSLPGDALAAMIYLTVLDLSRNSFSGSWPLQISQLKGIVVINISSNMMSGSIPLGLRGLHLLQTLDMSFNHFIGQIPADLGLLGDLITFNASYNNFSGPIPALGAFKENVTAASFLGNPGLCGGILGPQRQCPSSPARKSHCRGLYCTNVWIPVASVLGALIFVLVIGVSFVILSGHIQKKNACHKVFCNFYPQMRFMESEILAAIAPGQANVIGVGGQSVVYKGISPAGETVAIKVYRNVQGARDEDVAVKKRWEIDITREASTLGQIRHRNVVKFFCAFFNSEVSCIIMEYIPKGSLHAYLQRDEPTQLTWAQRFKILLGVTNGMVYLHHEFPDAIIHRDLKPSNILLDEDLEPKLCDFGISRFVTNDNGEATASTFCGTVGYIPPEYFKEGRLSTKGDVYSYGVVLLELLTTKVVAAYCVDTEDLVSIMEKTFDESAKIQVFELLQPSLQTEGYQNAITREQMMLAIRMGILCTRTLPQNRPSMNDVREMLLEIEQLGQETGTRRALVDLLDDQ